MHREDQQHEEHPYTSILGKSVKFSECEPSEEAIVGFIQSDLLEADI